VVPADLGVAEPDALFLFAVNAAQHRIDIHKGQDVGAGQDRCLAGQADQGVAGGGLQLPHAPVSEGAQEQTQR
jgi:hypothetical protein